MASVGEDHHDQKKQTVQKRRSYSFKNMFRRIKKNGVSASDINNTQERPKIPDESGMVQTKNDIVNKIDFADSENCGVNSDNPDPSIKVSAAETSHSKTNDQSLLSTSSAPVEISDSQVNSFFETTYDDDQDDNDGEIDCERTANGLDTSNCDKSSPNEITHNSVVISDSVQCPNTDINGSDKGSSVHNSDRSYSSNLEVQQENENLDKVSILCPPENKMALCFGELVPCTWLRW